MPNQNIENRQPAEDWKRELVEIFFARLGIIFFTTLVIALAAVAIALYMPPTYAAKGSVLMRSKSVQISPDALTAEQGSRLLGLGEEDISTEVEILSSPELARLALLRTYPDQYPEAQGEETNSEKLYEAVREIANNLSVEVQPGSKVLQLTLTDKDPERARKVLNSILNQYIVYRAGIFNPGGQQDFLTERSQLYRQKLEEIERELDQTARDSSVIMPEEEIQYNLELKRNLSEQLAQLEKDYVQLEKEVEPLRKAVASQDMQFFAFIESDAIDQLRSKLMDLTAERGEAMRRYLPDSAKVRGIEEQIDETYGALHAEVKQILNNREEELAALKRQKQLTMDAIGEIEKKNVDLKLHATKVQRLQREADLLKFSYETFSKRGEEAQISSAIADANFSGDVSILSAPEKAELAYPIPGITILIGIIVGFITGCSFGFLVEYLDHSIRRPSDIHRYTGLPVVCSIKRL